MTMNSRQITSTVCAALFVLGTVAGLAVLSAAPVKASEAYIQQSRGNAAGANIPAKQTPETTTQSGQPAPAAAAPATTAPDTCNAQNASSSQACYTATQQARPASK